MAANDPWAVRTLDGGDVPEAIPARRIRITVIAWLWLAAAAVQTVNLVFGVTGIRLNPHVRDLPASISNEVPAIFIFLLIGIGMLISRKLTPWLGLSLSVAALWVFGGYAFIQRMSLQHGILFIHDVFFVSYLAGAAAGVLTAIELFGKGSAEIHRPAVTPVSAPVRRRVQLTCLVGGGASVVALAVASFASVISISTVIGDVVPVTRLCCSYSSKPAFMDQSSAITGLIAMCALVVAAAFTRSRALSFAYLMGIALFALPAMGNYAIQPFFPATSVYGYGGAAIVAKQGFTTQVAFTGNFMLGLAGTVAVALVARYRLRIDRPLRSPYPVAGPTVVPEQPAGRAAAAVPEPTTGPEASA